MLNQATLKQCFAGMVGLRGSLDEKLPEVPAEYATPSSGIFLNSVHSLITVENMWSTIQDAGIVQLPTGTDPKGVLKAYLDARYTDATARLSNTIYVDKQLNNHAKSLLADTKLYDGVGSVQDTLERYGRFVGFRFRVKGGDVSAVIKRVGTQFDQVNNALKLYLYRSGTQEPLKVWEIDNNKPYYQQWAVLDQTGVPAITDDGHFFLGYYEDDVTGRAINKPVTFENPKCSGCNPTTYEYWRRWSKRMEFQAFYIDSNNVDPDRELWDEGAENLVDRHSWGLNLTISVSCDLSGVLCANKQLMANAYATQVGVMILEDMANTGRDNQQSKTLSQKAFYALDNKENHAPGLYKSMAMQIKVINIDLGSMNTECMPCQESGLVFGTIY